MRHWGASGTIAELERQGLVRRTKRPRPGNLTATVPCRALRSEYLRPYGFTIAHGFDKLAAVHLRRGGRIWEAQKRREAEACRFAITPEDLSRARGRSRRLDPENGPALHAPDNRRPAPRAGRLED